MRQAPKHIIVDIVCFCVAFCVGVEGFVVIRPEGQQRQERLDHRFLSFSLKLQSTSSSAIEYQSECGRGQDHLSAFLEEGDVVVYQTGSWMVDGVEVGDGSDPEFHYCQLETLQVVWTHNCEHGVLRCYHMDLRVAGDGPNMLVVSEDDEVVEFGPEQLVARVPVEWIDDHSEKDGMATQTAVPVVALSEAMWIEQ